MYGSPQLTRPQQQAASANLAYTDAPSLHSNFFLGGLHLFFWFFFHPSAWKNYALRVDPSLHPDVVLAELSQTQWHNPAIRRLLIQGYGIGSLLVGSIVAIALGALQLPIQDILFGVTSSVIGGLVFGLAVGMTVGLAPGMIGSVVTGLAGAIAYGIAYRLEGPVVNHVIIMTIANVAPGAAYASSMIISAAAFSLTLAVAGGIVAGVALTIPERSVSYQPRFSFGRQIGGVVIGLLLGSVAIGVDVVMAIVVTAHLLKSLVYMLLHGCVYGAAVAIASRGRWQTSIAVGLLVGALDGLVVVAAHTSPTSMIGGGIGGLGAALGFTPFFALPYVLARRIGGAWAGSVAGAVAFGGVCVGGFYAVIETNSSFAFLWPILPLSAISVVVGLTLAWSRPIVLYPVLAAWNTLLYRLDKRSPSANLHHLRWHSAFWDELQYLPLAGLDVHLALVATHNPHEGEAAIDYLTTTSQHRAAQSAQIELDACRLATCVCVVDIAQAWRSFVANELAGPASALLRTLIRISQDVDAAIGNPNRSSYNQRMALRAVADRLDSLLRELTRSSERYALRFRPIVAAWRSLVTTHLEQLATTSEQRQEIDSPYIIGVPLTDQEDIFVGRSDISARIEDLLLDRRCPPLLLYGQRRMGKTSLLNNLGRLLPRSIVPLFVDLQGPATQGVDHAGFVYNLTRSMIRSAQRHRNLALPPLPHELLQADPFTAFDEWLDAVEARLEEQTALLLLDEFEVLEQVVAEGRLNEQVVLGMFRHLIQHRPRFKVLLAGSHLLEEVQHWASYLINIQVVQVSYLTDAEARRLIEQPVDNFVLRYAPAASQHILDLTHGHPALVQLLCAEIIALKNEQSPALRRFVQVADVEAAVPHALKRGSFFFSDIQCNQVDEQGRRLLQFMALQGSGSVIQHEHLSLQCPGDVDRIIRQLLRRELIQWGENGYCFQIELIRRWFAQASTAQ